MITFTQEEQDKLTNIDERVKRGLLSDNGAAIERWDVACEVHDRILDEIKTETGMKANKDEYRKQLIEICDVINIKPKDHVFTFRKATQNRLFSRDSLLMHPLNFNIIGVEPLKEFADKEYPVINGECTVFVEDWDENIPLTLNLFWTSKFTEESYNFRGTILFDDDFAKFSAYVPIDFSQGKISIEKLRPKQRGDTWRTHYEHFRIINSVVFREIQNESKGFIKKVFIVNCQDDYGDIVELKLKASYIDDLPLCYYILGDVDYDDYCYGFVTHVDKDFKTGPELKLSPSNENRKSKLT